jgi:hypothetical protein
MSRHHDEIHILSPAQGQNSIGGVFCFVQNPPHPVIPELLLPEPSQPLLEVLDAFEESVT